MEDVFTGSAICKVSTEGLLTLPVGFRDIVRRKTGNGHLLVGLNECWSCLRVYDSAYAARQLQSIETRFGPGMDGQRDMRSTLMRRRFGFVAETVLDPVGTITIANWLRDLADIGHLVMIVATGADFEIWDLANVLESGSSDLKKLAKLHLQQSAAKEVCDEYLLSSLQSQGGTGRPAESGVRIQQMPPVQPRHDPIG